MISIGNYAFVYCWTLTSVTLGSGVKTIGDGAFAYNSNLSSIDIPDSVTSIGDMAFEYCQTLTSVTLGSGVKTIGDCAFANNNLSSIDIPNSVTDIGIYAFSNNPAIKSITIGNNVTYIGYYAFNKCKLSKANFVNNSTLDEETNDYWGALFTDYLIDDMYIIDNVLVNYYGYGGSVTVPGSVISIKENVFNYSDLTNIEIPNSVTSIGKGAFYHCLSLTSVNLPSSLRTLEPYTFDYCINLQNITLPDSLRKIGISTFDNCVSLKNVTINPMLDSIENNAFNNCKALDSIFIPKSVTSIRDCAFVGCDNLTIYCEAESQPEGWSENWNASECPVVWGHVPPEHNNSEDPEKHDTSILATYASNVNIYSKMNTIVVENADSEIMVYDSMGRLLSHRNNIADVVEIPMPNGIYIVKTRNDSKLVFVR